MEYRGIDYTVVQGIQRGVWKWSASVEGVMVVGHEQTRSAAVTAAEKVIDRALADPRKPIFGKSVDGKDEPSAEELNILRLALASFALKLDAFEARLKVRRGQTRKRATAPDRRPDAVTVADVLRGKPDRANR
jgi:hypothetical protein